MRATLLAIALLALLLGIAGCGSGGEEQSPSQSGSAPAPAQEGTTSSHEGQGGSNGPAGEQAPERLSAEADQSGSKTSQADPRIKALRQNFPKPKPASGAKEISTKAIAAGERACRGLTPEEVKDSFYSEAEPNLDPDQIELIEKLPRYEEEAPEDPNFVAGQIAATIYGATLDEAQRSYGFQGCVYVLARGVEGRL